METRYKYNESEWKIVESGDRTVSIDIGTDEMVGGVYREKDSGFLDPKVVEFIIGACKMHSDLVELLRETLKYLDSHWPDEKLLIAKISESLKNSEKFY